MYTLKPRQKFEMSSSILCQSRGCPIGPTSMRCELDCDAFDAPMDARVYLDYKNNSDRAVSAVKFRLRFVDAEQKDRAPSTSLAPAAAPQGVGGVKAKRDITLHPSIVGLKVRVLQVKYGDGSDWASTKNAGARQSKCSGRQLRDRPISTVSGKFGTYGRRRPPTCQTRPAAANYAAPPGNYAAPPGGYGAPAAAASPYSTGVRGKTYEVAPPGATQSYSSQSSNLNNAGSAQTIPPGPAQALPPQGSAAASPPGAAPAMTQGMPPVAPETSVAPAAPFYTPPPMPKIGTSPVFNPLTEPDSTDAAPALGLPPAAAAAPSVKASSPVKDIPAQGTAPAQAFNQAPAQAQAQAQMPVAATAAAQTTKPASATSNNVFATSPMAASDSAKQTVQSAQPSGNAFAAGAPGATYAPAINAANAGINPAVTSGVNSAANATATAGATAAARASSAAATNANTTLNTSPNTSAGSAVNSATKGPEPINTPWHP